MNDSKDHKAAAEPLLDCQVGHDTPRVEALIDRVMAMHPRHTAYGQARYYEEVHQHLAPLARDLERENAMLRKGDTCARVCEGTAYRIELQRLRADVMKVLPENWQEDVDWVRMIEAHGLTHNAKGEPGRTDHD